MTTVRGLLHACGHKLATCTTEGFIALLNAAALPAETRQLVGPLVTAPEVLNPQIALLDAAIDQLCAHEPVITGLTTAPAWDWVFAAGRG
ncbi:MULTISPECIES: hypothetical protein [Sorangium]|uniref:Uncharacterized protein n=1 Tax=Sorangium cellulosum TaxID=56 RepID=A0A4P2R4M5_SORCE|nr:MULTISPECIES: hypothetical protein [Sorangium]AUX37581.1 uncharacterized protein SOCE836_098100 [Sorangium cellulosum]WCQ96871.1 hypothetical protein NQZ70_09660 [Sorangium sp. Soce836]